MQTKTNTTIDVAGVYQENLGHASPTAFINNSSLGWAKITHPFHPHRGKSFKVLGLRRVSGVESLVLRLAADRSFYISKEWTNWSEPSLHSTLSAPHSIHNFGKLLVLAEMTELFSDQIKNGKK
jgi:hypothetical protein